jgi:hypothetical protein
MSRRGNLGIADCEKCMQTTAKIQRQSLGCGYEPRPDRVRLTIWQPPQGQRGYRGPELTTCAGYTANLPEVIEASIARAHWKNGALQMTEENEELGNAMLILDNEYSALEGWLMTPSKDGGGGA